MRGAANRRETFLLKRNRSRIAAAIGEIGKIKTGDRYLLKRIRLSDLGME